MAVLETPSSRKRRMSSSLPLSRETPNEPFERPSFRPEDLGEQGEEGGHDFGLDVALALDADILLHRHEGDACLGEGIEDGNDLTQRPTEPREFADDQTVAALEDVHQLVEPAALFGSLSRGGRLDEIVDAEIVCACVLKDGEALAAHVLLRGRDSQIGNGFHSLTMEYGF